MLQSNDTLSVGDKRLQVNEAEAQVRVIAVESLKDYGNYTVVTTRAATPEIRTGVARWELQRCHRLQQNRAR